MAQPRIFVSYSHQDDAFARRLVADLQKAGAQVWYDVIGIDHGDFMKRIDEALRQCEWLVLVLTPAAIASQYVQMEVNAALHRVQQGYMRAVIPILAAPCPPNSIPALWDVLQRYDATWVYEPARDGLFRAMGLVTPSTTPSTPAVSSAPPQAPPRPAPSGSSRPIGRKRLSLAGVGLVMGAIILGTLAYLQHQIGLVAVAHLNLYLGFLAIFVLVLGVAMLSLAARKA